MNNILVLNSGSQSEKVAVFKSDGKQLECVYRGQTKVGLGDQQERLDAIVELLTKSPIPADQLNVVGHRLVHGGSYFRNSTVANLEILSKLGQINELAPLHNPAAIAGVEASMKLLPQATQVMVFDTAFHSTMDEAHYLYAVPQEWQEFSIRKYGFHGISHQFCSKRVAELLGKKLSELNMISCHLGGGSSVCAIKAGKSIDTTMGFSPLDGVIMGTRCGAIDPAIIIYLLEHQKLTLAEIEVALNTKSGILGISGLSSDMQEIEAAMAQGNQRAKLAHEMFALSITKAIAAMITNFSELDAIAFTGGIGFHDPISRAAILPAGNLLNLNIDPAKNAKPGADHLISGLSPIKIFAVEANEELIIAQECLSLCHCPPIFTAAHP
ncbi:acetate kinase [soil metagenome]